MPLFPTPPVLSNPYGFLLFCETRHFAECTSRSFLCYNNEWGMEILISNNVNKSINKLHVKVVQMTCVQYLIAIKSYGSFR